MRKRRGRRMSRSKSRRSRRRSRRRRRRRRSRRRSQVNSSNEPEGPVHSHPPSHIIGNTAEKGKKESAEERMKPKLEAERCRKALGSYGEL